MFKNSNVPSNFFNFLCSSRNSCSKIRSSFSFQQVLSATDKILLDKLEFPSKISNILKALRFSLGVKFLKFQNVYILLLNTFSFPLDSELLLLCPLSGCCRLVWDHFYFRKKKKSSLVFASCFFPPTFPTSTPPSSTTNIPKKKRSQPAIENLVLYCDVIWTRIIIENSMIESSDITFLDCMDIVSVSSQCLAFFRLLHLTHSFVLFYI